MFLQTLDFTQSDLLCRNCGHSVTTASALRNVRSPNTIDSWNMTILGVDTLVQVFRNSVPETFNVILANGADLKFAGKAHSEETWFPGHSWRSCICSSCNSHIGWYFQSPKDDFVALVLDYLISSEYADTLTKVALPPYLHHHHHHHNLEHLKEMPGVIYIQSVPPLFTVKHLREIMCRHGELGRVYLQAEKRGPKRRKRYTEGWIEFKSKRVAKDVAQMLNGQLVGGRRRSAAYDCMWTMKYLHGFKWDHLMEQLAYERRVEQQRLQTEIVQEKRKADHFSQQLEKGQRLKQLEEKILKKSGLWQRYQLQHQQRQVFQDDDQQRSKELNGSEGFLKMIFDVEG